MTGIYHGKYQNKYYDTVKDYHGRIKVVVNQTRSLIENIIDRRVIEKFLVSLTRKSKD